MKSQPGSEESRDPDTRPARPGGGDTEDRQRQPGGHEESLRETLHLTKKYGSVMRAPGVRPGATEGRLELIEDALFSGRSVVLTVERASACMAIGYYVDTSGNPHVLVWTGGSWAAERTLLPANTLRRTL